MTDSLNKPATHDLQGRPLSPAAAKFAKAAFENLKAVSLKKKDTKESKGTA